MMQVGEFIDLVGEYLQEDFSTSPVWSRSEVLGYVRQVGRVFCDMTGLVDKNEIRLIDGTTGEADMPRDFGKMYFCQHELRHLDNVELGELDFVTDGWMSGVKGTPRAVSQIGQGDGAEVRYVPVPNSVWDGGPAGSPTTPGVTFLSPTLEKWYVQCNRGVVETVLTPAAPSTVSSKVLAGPSTFWNLYSHNGGILYTYASTSTTADEVVLEDTSGGSNYWWLLCTDYGEVYTHPVYSHYGLAVGALLDYGWWVDFSQDLGVIVDAYVSTGGSGVENSIRLDSFVGTSLYSQTSTGSGMVWYKGNIKEIGSEISRLWLSPGFLPVLLHGVLGLCYAHDGDGRDLEKARLLRAIFTAECQSIQGSFKTRWA